MWELDHKESFFIKKIKMISLERKQSIEELMLLNCGVGEDS